MANYNRVSYKERRDLYECFEAGMSFADIHELTGRSTSTINRVKREWKQEREVPEIEAAVEPEPEKTEPTIADSDYAKAVEAGDPRYGNSSLDIRKTLTIESHKTNIRYEMVDKDELRISFSDGNTVTMTLRAFEKFVDESVDVCLECAKYAKTI